MSLRDYVHNNLMATQSQTRPSRKAVDDSWSRFCDVANHPPSRNSDTFGDWQRRRDQLKREHLIIKGRFFGTREQRICWTAHIWSSTYGAPVHELKLMGFTNHEISEGCFLGRAVEREYQMNCRSHGDPAYGSWGIHSPAPAQPHRDRITAGLADWTNAR